MKRWLGLMVLVFFKSILSYDAETYCFVLVVPKSEQAYQCTIFGLNEMRVSRFPSGPAWSNSTKNCKWKDLDCSQHCELLSLSNKLPVLCIDEGWLKEYQINRSNKNLCGFALPWDSGMAYVFDDLYQVENISGLIVLCDKLVQMNLLNVPNQFTDLDDDMDDIDRLVAGVDGEEMMSKPLPYPLDQIKIVCGQLFIAALLKYHQIKDKFSAYLRLKHGS